MNRPPAIIGIGRNYAKHAAELGNERPAHPLVFYKNPASICGNGEDIVLPATLGTPSLGVDYEGELAVILGSNTRDVAREEAFACVSHFAVANDVELGREQAEQSILDGLAAFEVMHTEYCSCP